MQLGKLNEAVRHVPDLQCFLRSFVIRKVAPELAPNKIHAILHQLLQLLPAVCLVLAWRLRKIGFLRF